MITGELKSKMDKVWTTIWTGGVASPSSAIEQITYLLFMKMLDDLELRKEANASALGIEYKSKMFPDGEFVPKDSSTGTAYSNLRWSNFHKFAPARMFDTVRNYVFPFITVVNGTGKDTAFSQYMNDAVFLIRDAKVLLICVDELNTIDVTNTDIMGDVYEYCLGKMAASGTLGQFRTPRHIIDMIVDIVKPTVDDYILDPAMGTAGFLQSSAKYIQDHQAKEMLNKEVNKHFNSTMFSGFDTDATMLRIGAMNMLLHGVEEPNIKRMNSLSEDNDDRDYYSLILANPPFKGSIFEDETSKDILSICNSKKTELLFLALFIKSLRIGGRCACIVPDGVLFGSSKAHKDIRRELIENNRLEAVISMPSGVFKPYAGVSTAVLVFHKDPAGTNKVWFYDMKADGYSLDDKRSPIADNDIPDILNRYNNLEQEENRERTEQSFFVDKEEIVNNDYDLSINKYKKTEYVAVEYPPTSEIIAGIDELEKQIALEMSELKKLLNL
ncbi:MAG: SAM-dependent DNA methyltransferase [Clostridiales bacterium]|nr:SAM-dependent DNA methyltransferase [Candidatus Scatonaster coprocaballi]